MTTVIEVKPIDTKSARESTEIAEGLMNETSLFKIKTQIDYELAADMLKRIKSKYNEVDNIRKNITKPLDMAKKAVMELFNKPLTLLSNAESKLKENMIAFHNEQERIRKAEEEKLRKKAEEEELKKKEALEVRAQKAEEKGDTEKANELREKKEDIFVPTPILSEPEQPKGISYKTLWSAEIVDQSQIPREYLIPNMQLLDKLASVYKDTKEIPGIKFVSKKILSGRINIPPAVRQRHDSRVGEQKIEKRDE